jgi:hypothetical protein
MRLGCRCSDNRTDRFRKTWRKHQQALLQSEEGGASETLIFGDGRDVVVRTTTSARNDDLGRDDDAADGLTSEDDDDDDDEGARRLFRLLRPSDILRRRSDSFGGSLRSSGSGKAPDEGSGASAGETPGTARQSTSKSQGTANNLLSDFTPSESLARARPRSPDQGNSNNSNLPSTLPSSALKNAGLQHGLAEPSSLQETMSTIACMAKVSVRDRRYRFRVYRQCFIGSQLIDVLMENECASTRNGALQMALAINRRFQLFKHVVDDHPLKDDVRAFLYWCCHGVVFMRRRQLSTFELYRYCGFS